MSKMCLRYAKNMPKICLKYAQDMPKICQRYVEEIRKKLGGKMSTISAKKLYFWEKCFQAEICRDNQEFFLRVTPFLKALTQLLWQDSLVNALTYIALSQITEFLSIFLASKLHSCKLFDKSHVS